MDALLRRAWTAVALAAGIAVTGCGFPGAPLPPSLNLPFWVPAITLTGNIGDQLRLDCINQFGPTNAWMTLGTVTLTNTSQLYFDLSAPGQPRRLYRIVPVP